MSVRPKKEAALFSLKDPTVAIVGFGYVGLVIGVFLCERGFRVTAIDTNPRLVAQLSHGKTPVKEKDAAQALSKFIAAGQLKVSSQLEDVSKAAVVLITVGTPLNDDYSPSLEQLRLACLGLGKHIRKGHLVIVKSTVVPGITEDEVLPTLERESGLRAEKDFFLAYCPERLAEGAHIQDFQGSALEEVKRIPIVVGGIGALSTQKTSEFWKSAGLEVIEVSSPRTAEMVKLADNLWIDLNIAMANEIGMLCERIGIDTLEVIKGANSLPKGWGNINILFPGSGVGGSCLPKDPWFLHYFALKQGLELSIPKVSRKVNDSMPRHMFDLIEESLREDGKTLPHSKVAILGLAYKNATHDIRYTPAKELIRLLQEAGAKVAAFDPWVEEEEVKGMMDVELAPDLDGVISGADCIALVTPHPEYRSISFNDIRNMVSNPCSVVDGRRAFDPRIVREAGFGYRAVGLGDPTRGWRSL